MADTSIEWATKVWNFLRGCSLVSTGCTSCYAMKQAHRFSGPGGAYQGLTRLRDNGKGAVWTGDVRFVAEKLADPLRWKKPERVFVNSMSDLFHEDVTDEQIAAAFGVMAACPHHEFLILTKRAERMRRWLTSENMPGLCESACAALDKAGVARGCGSAFDPDEWPLKNVWLGVSVEDQQRADERVPHLLATSAAVRFLSVEPLLGPVDLTPWLYPETYASLDEVKTPAIDWVIVGGESGPGARPCAEEWIASVVEQCSAAGVACFVKQLGAYVVSEERTAPREMFQREDVDLAPNGEAWAWRAGLVDKKGGDPSEWSEELRVRQFPVVRR